jgi:hypothetical protein
MAMPTIRPIEPVAWAKLAAGWRCRGMAMEA